MKSHAELIRDFDAAGVGFLLTELDVAYSFTTVANGPYAFYRKQRLLHGAKRAYSQALSMRRRFHLTAQEEERFQKISASVERALTGFATESMPDPEARTVS
jgi:hypothetical protein